MPGSRHKIRAPRARNLVVVPVFTSDRGVFPYISGGGCHSPLSTFSLPLPLPLPLPTILLNPSSIIKDSHFTYFTHLTTLDALLDPALQEKE
jgi:hypothetical protein